MLNETVDEALRRLDERPRSIVAMVLGGYDRETIQREVGCSDRTVRRTLARFQDLLTKHSDEFSQ